MCWQVAQEPAVVPPRRRPARYLRLGVPPRDVLHVRPNWPAEHAIREPTRRDGVAARYYWWQGGGEESSRAKHRSSLAHPVDDCRRVRRVARAADRGDGPNDPPGRR